MAQKAREEANKWLHEVAQAQAGLLNKVVPLRTKIAGLETAAETSKAYQKKLEDQCVDREQKLGKMEIALANKTDENASLQAKVRELTYALASKDQEMTAQAANFKVAEEKLIGEAATGSPMGSQRPLFKLPVQTSASMSLGAAPSMKWSMASLCLWRPPRNKLLLVSTKTPDVYMVTFCLTCNRHEP